MTQSCCGFIPLRKACFLIGLLTIFLQQIPTLTLAFVIYFSDSLDLELGEMWFSLNIATYVLLVTFSVLLEVGVFRKSASWILPWLIYEPVAMVLHVMFMFFITINISKLEEVPESIYITVVFTWATALLFGGMWIYFCLRVLDYYKRLRRRERQTATRLEWQQSDA